MYLLIDNYDSFTYNLFQYFAEQGVSMLVRRNDRISVEEITALAPDKIIISPGPKTPAEAGISNEVIRIFGPKRVPILGICLGHQCIADVFGGRISRVKKILHGKTSPVYHNGKGIFKNMPNPFNAARYHSLETSGLPPCLEITAWTGDNVIMGIRHRDMPVEGLQFHPESFLTGNGKVLISNFINS
ncbi:MAG: aminodeoxychorismate/anthranilate synthase component II [Candidatus Omnitrophota bacterium]